MQTQVSVSGGLPENPSRKQRVWIRAAMVKSAEYHHVHHIPKHFQGGAATKYGYRRRSPRWQGLKKSLTGATLPLIFTGTTKDEITGQREIRATSTRGATLIMRASLKGLSSGRFRMKKGQFALSDQQKLIRGLVEEIRAVTADEMNRLAAVQEAEYQRQYEDSLR